jgi:large subunit ribosomal protein L25
MTETQEFVITVEKRTETGKGIAGKMRRSGLIPAVVYGGDKPPIAISVEEQSLRDLLKQKGGENTIFLLKLKGTDEERQAMIRELQTDPISGKFLHIDFIRITKGQKLTVSMPIELIGDSVGVRGGGRVDFVSRDLQIELLPRDMFDKITLDISDLDLGENISVGELEDKLPPSARFLDDPSRVVVVIEIPRLAIEEEEKEEVVEEAVIGETAEPELIRKGKEGEGKEGGGE